MQIKTQLLQITLRNFYPKTQSISTQNLLTIAKRIKQKRPSINPAVFVVCLFGSE